MCTALCPLHVLVILLVAFAYFEHPWTIMASEFPERECCDPVYPIPAPGPHSGHGGIAPAFPEYVASTPPPTTDTPGVQTKTATTMMNCIQARDFCMDNSACSPILAMVPRVCGSEKVACSTVTITKCQAALRTLQAFPYFAPICLCPTPSSDPACSTFREYLFDHPCNFVKEKEKDPYPVDALPTCDYAMDVCKKQPKCIQLYRDFKAHCKITEGHCKMEDWDLCHDAWTRLRLSPMFGCICPNGNGRCDRIFNDVNYNPCVASGPYIDFTNTKSALYTLEGHKDMGLSHYSFSPASLFPKPDMHRFHEHASPDYESNLVVPAARTDSHLFVDESLSTPVTYHGYSSPPSQSSNNNHNPPTRHHQQHSGSITVQVISASHAPDHEIESQLETPLLGPASPHKPPPPFVPTIYFPPNKIFAPHHHQPANVNPQVQSTDQQPPRLNSGIATISSVRPHGNYNRRDRYHDKIPPPVTCYSALQNCLRNPSCSTLLQAVLYWCHHSRCRQDTCMLALQSFYRGVETKWALEVAFCLCRKSDNPHDQCLLAQEQLHPVCAQRGDQGANPPLCHTLAEGCRVQPDCKARLEHFEQSCAVDSVTRKCAGPSSECRLGILGILGTKLRSTCACNGTDTTQLYDCLGWQRILWINPCVVETQKEYIRQRAAAMVTPASTPRSTSTQSHHVSTESVTISSESETVTGRDILSTSIVNNPYHSTATDTTTLRTQGRSVQGVTNPADGYYGSSITTGGSSTSSSSRGTTTTEDVTTLSTTTSRPMTTTTTAPPRYCVIRRPNQRDQKIIEGTSKRLYREDKPSCSELCVCVQGEPPACNVLDCLDARGCEASTQKIPSPVAYVHQQPLYQAFRGHCICYAGDFICAKPSEGTYTLYPGVFLFLGYSKKDEEVLKPHTYRSALDVVQALQQLIAPHFHHHYVQHPEDSVSKLRKLNATGCRLDLFKSEDENLIINATLSEDDFANVSVRQTVSESLLIKEKEQCLPVLEVLRDLVNENDPIIHNHALLSILKKADVVINSIPPSTNVPSVGAPKVSAFVVVVFFLPIHFLLSIVSILVTARMPLL